MLKLNKLIWFFLICTVVFSELTGAVPKKEKEYPEAPAFDPRFEWLNVSRPLTIKDLRGKVAVLDFWTYGCINCIHVNAELRRLEDKFGDKIAIIAVHSPKFDNEKNLETLRNIVVRYDRRHPVVSDPERAMMEAYGVRAWPTLVVLDPTGRVLGAVIGEGHYDVLEEVTEELLEEHADIIDSTPLPIALEKEHFAQSTLAAPGKIAVSAKHVAISDTLHHRVVVTDHDGRIEKSFGMGEPGARDGNRDTAQFSSPQGVAFGPDGLYVADTGNHLIRRVSFGDDTVSTVAGKVGADMPRKGTFDALDIGLRSPWGLAVRAPWLYIAMAGTHQIWRLNLETGKLQRFAGSRREGIADGSLTRAEFSQPSGLSVVDDWLYVADAEDSAVRRIDLKAGRVETLVGTGLHDFGDKDGKFDEALLQHVKGVVAVDAQTVVIADTYNHKLKQLDLASRTIETLVGTGAPGRGAGNGLEVQLNEPGGVAVLGRQVLIADTNNNRILAYDMDTGKTDEWEIGEAHEREGRNNDR